MPKEKVRKIASMGGKAHAKQFHDDDDNNEEDENNEGWLNFLFR